MKFKDGRPISHPDKAVKIVPLSFIIVLLCGISFYLGGVFNNIDAKDITDAVTKTEQKRTTKSAVAPLQIKSVSFPICGVEYQDYTPCTDPRRWKKYGYKRLAFLERHCPPIFERKECLVPPPEGYKLPIRWPKSKNECWYRNVPYDWINKQKSNQHWLKKEGEKFFFPGGGTMFPKGVSHYVDLMENLLPQLKDGTIRTAIDTGCGVASWGGDLLDRGILTVSLAPRDNHEAQVQFALERGIPAILGVISTQRLPFPSSSFDMAHCSRCLIPWTEFGGVYLMEIHRILRPGGFWVLSGPPVNYENRWRGWNTTVEEQRSDYEKLQELLTSMCFKLFSKKDDIAVWRKASDNSCYDEKLANPDAYPPKCDDSVEPDSAWYTPLRSCVTVPNPKFKKLSLKSVSKWPQRLDVAPDRLSDIPGGNGGAFKHDESKWKVRVKHYKKLVPALGSDKIRNVMDMNTVYGGLAAQLIEDPVWVMNVVSSYGPNTLPVVYDRGLIGAYHDWCEPFSTYPRTYDLLHADGLFTAESHRCDMKYVLLEMDRILRPSGYAIIRENNYFVDSISTIAKGMKWECRKEDEFGPLLKFEDVMRETEKHGVTLPSDILEAAKTTGIRELILMRYLELQGLFWPLGFLMRHCSMLRNRMIADPAFLFKVGTEIVIDSCCATFAEVQKRGKDFWNEFELYAADLLVGVVVDIALVGMLAPYVRIGQQTVSRGLLGRFQLACRNLPSSVFEAERPGCRFSVKQRIASYFYKGVLYGAVGFGCGIVGQGIANMIMTAKRNIKKSDDDVPVPPLVKSAALWGVFLAISSNTRYQIVNGLERVVETSPLAKQVPSVAMAFTVGVRFANNIYGGMQFVDWAKLSGVQ